jgi:hypothetical protein
MVRAMSEYELLLEETREALASDEQGFAYAPGIDENVWELVWLLAEGLGLVTHDSCGGHGAGHAAGREPAGKWRCGIYRFPEDDSEGFDLLVRAVHEAQRSGVAVTLEEEPRMDESCWYLRGEGDPAVFVERATKVLNAAVAAEDDEP